MSLTDEIARINRVYASNPRLRDAIIADAKNIFAGLPDDPAPAADKAPALSARQSEWNDLRWGAILANKTEPEAQRLATIELARRHDEPVPIDLLTAPELRAHLAATAAAREMTKGLGGNDPFADDEPVKDTRTKEQLLEDASKQMKAGLNQPDTDWDPYAARRAKLAEAEASTAATKAKDAQYAALRSAWDAAQQATDEG